VVFHKGWVFLEVLQIAEQRVDLLRCMRTETMTNVMKQSGHTEVSQIPVCAIVVYGQRAAFGIGVFSNGVETPLGQSRSAERVLESGVGGAWVDVVDQASLLYAPESLQDGAIDDGHLLPCEEKIS
jgi:hypothetical protein